MKRPHVLWHRPRALEISSGWDPLLLGAGSASSLEQQNRQGGHWLPRSLPAQAIARVPMPGAGVSSPLPGLVLFLLSHRLVKKWNLSCRGLARGAGFLGEKNRPNALFLSLSNVPSSKTCWQSLRADDIFQNIDKNREALPPTIEKNYFHKVFLLSTLSLTTFTDSSSLSKHLHRLTPFHSKKSCLLGRADTPDP